MKPKFLLRSFILLAVTTGGIFYLSIAGKASANRIKLQQEVSEKPMAETSNTDYIFFGSISRFFAISISK